MGSTRTLSPASAEYGLEVLHPTTKGPWTFEVISSMYQSQNLLRGDRGQSIGRWFDILKFVDSRREVIIHVLFPDVAATAELGRHDEVQHLRRPASLDIAQGKLPFRLSRGPGW